MKKTPVAVAYGDGIGPEIMQATLDILESAAANIEIHPLEMGERAYLLGHTSGIEEGAWDLLFSTQAFLKAPMTTPQGGGYKSLNVTIRGSLGLYANVRPCSSYAPFIPTKHPHMDLVIIRENMEDLYTGIEYRPTPHTATALKFITRAGCERICHYAFEYARQHQRKKVSCFTKDNILKKTDGLFHRIFEEVAQLYPEIQSEHWIVDIGSAKIADTPEIFDVVVLPNLYGDILSDITAQITGSVGLVGTANIGEKGAMFEAIHGSAPSLAGKGVANPSGLLLASVLMLQYLHQPEVAMRIHNAWLKTIEEGLHTPDILQPHSQHKSLNTQEFTREIIARLGQVPQTLPAVHYSSMQERVLKPEAKKMQRPEPERQLVGVDLFIYALEPLESLQKRCMRASTPSLSLTRITNRGITFWPESHSKATPSELWCCRFLSKSATSLQSIAMLIHRFGDAELDVTHAENLYTYEGQPGY